MNSYHKHLHIISFDIPYPPNYGGVIDVYYKLKTLAEEGVKIHLHCYEYGRNQASELESLCQEVIYYKRSIYKNPFYGKLPYIVSTRNTQELIDNLLKDKHPILFEGLHTCYYLSDERLNDRIKIVRTHNIEHDYYANLEKVEANYFKKYFFSKESQRLQLFQQQLLHATAVAAISKADYIYFNQLFPQAVYLPPFHSNDVPLTPVGRGDFVLYHGNLGVGENEEAAKYIIQQVWANLQIPLVLAGSHPSRALKRLCENHPHITLYDRLDTEQIMSLIGRAHINFLPTFQATGIKLKLVNALYNGRYCLVNQYMVQETGLESLCEVADTPELMIAAVKKLWSADWQPSALRSASLSADFSNHKNIGILIDLIQQ
jgi:hypothetical protein